MNRIADNINILGTFCGTRDVPELTKEALYNKYKLEKADIMVLFGGSIPAGGEVLANAMKNGIAKSYVIVGGAGHTTDTLRCKMQAVLPDIDTTNMSEAEIFAAFLKEKHGLAPDFLECKSTNCGNNITYLLELLREKGIEFENIILIQDATMQRRMDAGLRKYAPQVNIINYAAYSATVKAEGNSLSFTDDIWGMWDMERYISLLMGEIPRLTDDAEGYGPKGKDFIAHVDIPDEVLKAFDGLKENYAELIRGANPLFASK